MTTLNFPYALVSGFLLYENTSSYFEASDYEPYAWCRNIMSQCVLDAICLWGRVIYMWWAKLILG